MNTRTKATWLSLAALLLLLVFNFFTRLADIPVRIWDEARNADNALEMFLRGRWLTPYYEGGIDLWNTKPPLLIWMQAGGMYIFGTGEWALRLPAAIAATLTGVLLWRWLGKRLNAPWAGFLAGAVLAATYAYVDNHAARTGDYDTLLVLFMTASALSLFNWTLEARPKYILVFFISLALAVLTKGVAGLTLLPGLALFVLVQKKVVALLRNRHFYIGLFIFIFLVGGYYGLREHLNPGYLHAVYENELGGRYLHTLEGHQYPFWFYFNNLRDWRFSYWFYLILPAFVLGAFRSPLVKKITLFNLLMVVPFWLIISLGGTKLDWYELPLYPFLCLQIGIFLYETGLWIYERTGRHALLIVGLFALLFYFPLRGNSKRIFHFTEKPWDEEPHRQAYFLKDGIDHQKTFDGYRFCYSDYNGQLYYYILRLQARHSTVQLSSDVEGLSAGQLVVVSQPQLEQELTRRYRVEKRGENFGCTVYLVLDRL